jgi:glycerol-3-phosphate acyltransferase PlsX
MSSPSPVRIAVDAMGGDFAPAEIVQGAVEAAAQGGVQVLLVGDPEAVERELARHDTAGLPIISVPSEGVVLEGESPVQVLREKSRASIVVATGLVKAGKADALVSMGSTGATMAASAFLLGLMEGIERPAIGGHIIGLAPNTVILDLGSNVDCRPGQLLSFAALGTTFARVYLGIAEPRVALLSVGAEEGKGNRQTKETYQLLKASHLNFIGNIEGHDIPRGAADVVVCDGFVGNVVMKLMEGLGGELAAHLSRRLEGRLDREELDSLTQEVYALLNKAEQSGGGPLFGVRGISIVGHGQARAPAVSRAIGTARQISEMDLMGKMEAELALLGKPE